MTLNASGQVSEGFAFAGLIFGFDLTGAVFKLSQLIKMIHRLKYIGCNYGKILDSFFSAQSNIFRVRKEEEDSNIRLALESDYKLKHGEVPILLFRKTNIQSMIK